MVAFVFAVLVLATAATGALFKPGSWYESLQRPSWTPPNWSFPVVWSILYVMIGIAGWLVWREMGASAALFFWGFQLLLNAAWSWLFFGLKRMDWALFDVALLILAIFGFIIAAHESVPVASYLFLPYLAWVATAAALNLRMLQMNPTAQHALARLPRLP